MRLESRVVVGRRLPTDCAPVSDEVPTTAEAVALGHLAAKLDELAVLGKLPEDSANSEALELLNGWCSGGRRRPLEFLLEIPALRDPFLASQSSKVPSSFIPIRVLGRVASRPVAMILVDERMTPSHF